MASLESFLAKWTDSSGSEKANSQLFFTELCDVLDLPHPSPATNDPSKDDYVFERRTFDHVAANSERVRWIDVYRKHCFVLESKQGAADSGRGFARRGTAAWNNEMQKAHGQALAYAKTLKDPPPFLIIVDVGHVFELHATFDGSTHWRPFPDPPRQRIFLAELNNPDKLAVLRSALSDPAALDPSKRQTRVTREIAENIAELAKTLEKAGHGAEAVARFLMRCLFTMFAEDVGLFEGKKKLFQEYIEQYWLKNPPSFPNGVSVLWQTMNTGGVLMTGERVHRFNGGLFAEHSAPPMTKAQLETLLAAAKHDWSDVEPAIFGTLLERALDPKERHALGAHFTPRAYVERLVRPTLEEPLRAEWLVVRAEARLLIERSIGKSAGEATKDETAALAVLKDFHSRLCKIRVLDPACGSGNFLYVALDLMKQLEGEVLDEIGRVGGAQSERLELDAITITPRQFLGIEKKPWAKEIAELVLWIGFLRWQWRLRGTTVIGDGPILEDAKNIECRDAVLDWDGAPYEKPKLDEHGRVITRWDGETKKKDPLTGQDVPDETATVAIYEYPNARKATWPAADYIVGNPPFIGNFKMRQDLGDGYVEALRSAWSDVPESSDLVMYWWDRAARLVRSGAVRRSGLVTTTSITQTFNRRVLQEHLGADDPISIVFAAQDHPWATSKYGDAKGGAEVRIAMTVIAPGEHPGMLAAVVREEQLSDGDVRVDLSMSYGLIHPNLTIGADVVAAQPLIANEEIGCPGVKLHGAGFIVTPDEAATLGLGRILGLERHIRRYCNGQDLMAKSREVMVIDLLGLSAADVMRRFPEVYQWVLNRVKPERDAKAHSKDGAGYAKLWWLHGKPRPNMRSALEGLRRFIGTTESARRRFFVFIEGDVIPDNTIVTIALDDPFALGVLSSRIHVAWALAAGGRLGVRNDPRYNKTRCFDPYPFPVCGEQQRSVIGKLAESLDAHRKRQQQLHPNLAMTKVYKVLAMVRDGEALEPAEQLIHEQGLVSVLKKIHDDLDAAVFDAYGWPQTLTDEQILEKLVALNAERAAEEARGLIRWLRPEFQAPTQKPTQLVSSEAARPSTAPTAIAARPWPKTFFERASTIRDLVYAIPEGTTFDAQSLDALFTATKTKARTTEIESILDTFAALGQLIPIGGAKKHQYARPMREVG